MNTKKIIGYGILAVIFTLAFIACDDGSKDVINSVIDGTPDIASFAGTWNASGNRSCTFSGNNFTYKVNGITQYSGTFAVSGSTITFTISSGSASGNFTLSATTLVLSNHTWDNSVNGTYTKVPANTEEVVGSYVANAPNPYVNLTSEYAYSVVNLPGENKTNVIKVVNPTGGYRPVYYDLSAYKNKEITITVSVKVKRVGAVGNLCWNINNSDWPVIGDNGYIDSPTLNTWYSMGGTWTGTPVGRPDINDAPNLYLNGWENNSEITTYYIADFEITITGSDVTPTVTLNSVIANGTAMQTTTQLTLTFSAAITGLSANDIALSGVAGVSKGTLSGSGPAYTLPISGFTQGGNLSVSVTKAGYVINGSPKPAAIYYYSGGGGDDVWSNVPNISQLNGTWKAPPSVGPYNVQEGITATQSFTNYTVTFNATAKTMTTSGTGTTTLSGSITNTQWSNMKSNLQSQFQGLDGLTLTFDDANHSYTMVYNNVSITVPDGYFPNPNYQINQNGTKLKVGVSGAGGYEIIYTKDSSVGTTAIEGTWNASGNRSCAFTGNNFTYKVNGTTQYSGTFSVSGSVITWTVSGVAVTSNFQLSGNTLTISNHSYDSSINGTYTKDAGGGFAYTKSGTTYTINSNGSQPIQTVIEAIRTDANGAACTIQFGSGGSNVLDTGTNGIQFNNTGGTWGVVTLTGKITSAETYNGGTIINSAPISIVSTADITNTAGTAFRNLGTVTISGGTVSSPQYAIINVITESTVTINGGTVKTTASSTYAAVNNNTGQLTITSGTVTSTSGMAVSNAGGTVTINGGTVSSTGGSISTQTVFNSPSTYDSTGGTLTISGQAIITAASGVAVNNYGTVTMSGGTIETAGTSGRAIYNASGSFTITGGTVSTTGTGANANAVCINGGTVTISGGTITATGTGSYAVYQISGTVTIHDPPAVITGNTYGTITWIPPKDSVTYAVGDTGPGGGKIIFVSTGGFTVAGYGNPGDSGYFTSYTAHYLEAAPANMSTTLMWAPTTSPAYSNISAAQGEGRGDGRKNTAAILAAASANPATNAPAAHACNTYSNNGKSDWFLPSIEELKLLYSNRTAVGIAASGNYWSSSQSALNGYSNLAWITNFVNGLSSHDETYKYSTFSVRAVRAF